MVKNKKQNAATPAKPYERFTLANAMRNTCKCVEHTYGEEMPIFPANSDYIQQKEKQRQQIISLHKKGMLPDDILTHFVRTKNVYGESLDTEYERLRVERMKQYIDVVITEYECSIENER